MQIHIDRGGERYGPYSIEEVNAYLANGTLLPTDQAWQDGMADWVALSQFPGVTAAPPTPPAGAGATCPQCQAPVEINQVICMGCGTRLQGAPAAAGSGSKKALLISLGVAGVIALAAGSYFLFFSGDGSKEENETATETDNPKTPEKLAELAFNAIAKNDYAAFVKLHAVSKKKEEILEIILEDKYPIDDEAIKKYAEHEEITEEEAKKEIKDRRTRFSEKAFDKRWYDELKREKKRVQEAFEKVVAELKDYDIDWSKAELLRVDKKHTKVGQIERGDIFIVFLHNDEEFTIRLERCMSLGLDGWIVIIGPRLVSSG